MDCLGELKDVAAQLDRAGFVLRPGWAALRDGARPLSFPAPNLASGNTGGSAMRLPLPNTIFGRPRLSFACPADQAHLWSHTGPGSNSILLGAPTNFESRLIPEHFRTLVLERLRLPLSVVEAKCECGMLLDSLGRHRAACPAYLKRCGFTP